MNVITLSLIGIAGYLIMASKPVAAKISSEYQAPIRVDDYISDNPYAYSLWSTPPKGQQYNYVFNAAEIEYDLPPGLLAAMALQESNYNPDAIGRSGEQGMMQIIPKWHPTISNPFDPEQAIVYAGKIMRKYYNEFGTWDHAIAAYNWGETNVRNKGLDAAPASTKSYISKTLNRIGFA